MEINGLSDARIIEILAKSPVKSFNVLLDVLNYIDGQCILEDIEYEMFDWALGDNEQNATTIKVHNISGMPAIMLHKLTRTLQHFNLVRRRVRRTESQFNEPDGLDIIAVYQLTNSGRKFRELLQCIVQGKEQIVKRPKT